MWSRTILALTSAALLLSAAPAPDHLGRSTPRGTVIEFLRAAGNSKDATACEYLEVAGRPGDPANAQTRDLARKLKAVLDGTVSIHLDEIADTAEGALDDGLPPDAERIATVRNGTRDIDLKLRRVSTPAGAQVWLFSTETLRSVPGLYADLAPSALERMLPAALVGKRLLDVAVWRWLALLVVAPLALLMAYGLAVFLLRILDSVSRRTATEIDEQLVPLLRGPLVLFLAVCLFHPAMLALGLPLLLRQGLRQLELLLAVIAAVWFVMRLIDLGASRARMTLLRSQRVAAVSIVPLGRRIGKVLIVALGLLLVLDNAGFDLRALLTGLGVGGIAVALAAQKTLENIFGAFALVIDQPVRVGDFCRFEDRVGTVEDIGLRSTRVRTLDRTVISVPNAQFSTMNIENFGPREKIWFHPVLALRLDTTAAQTREILDRTRELLDTHPKVEKGGRIRLAGFGTASINLEVFAYVDTASYDEYVIIQEELLLRIMEIIEQAGTSIAMPGQMDYLTRPRSA